MRNRFRIPFLFLAIFVVLACQKTESAPQTDSNAQSTTATSATTASTPTQTGTVPPDTWVDNVVIELGTEAGPDGALPVGAATNEFKAGQSVVVSMEVSAAPANTLIKLVWLGPKDSKIGEETKTTATGQKYVTFSRTDTKKWAKGDYRIEIWFGDKNVGAQAFKIS